ncbi:MAG: hypothetical protein V4513_08000 [Pseudomonadota bacterium]
MSSDTPRDLSPLISVDYDNFAQPNDFSLIERCDLARPRIYIYCFAQYEIGRCAVPNELQVTQALLVSEIVRVVGISGMIDKPDELLTVACMPFVLPDA